MNGIVVRFDGSRITTQLEFMSSYVWQDCFDFFVLKRKLLGTL